MFPVELRITDEDALIEKMTAMREWLDHRRFEPLTFRYTFEHPGMLFRIDFAIEVQAAAFAKEFGGCVIALSGEGSSQAAD